MNTVMTLSKFACRRQVNIAEEVFTTWNTSTPEGIKAALRDAAWKGALAMLEIVEEIERVRNDD